MPLMIGLLGARGHGGCDSAEGAGTIGLTWPTNW